MCDGWLRRDSELKLLSSQARQRREAYLRSLFLPRAEDMEMEHTEDGPFELSKQEEHSYLCGHGKSKRYGPKISVCIHHEDQELLPLENPLKAQIIEEERTLGRSATSVKPTHVEGGKSDLIGLLAIRGKFEELSLLEAHMVKLTFFGPAYERAYMDGVIGDSALFKHVDTPGKTTVTLLPHDTLLEYGTVLFLHYWSMELFYFYIIGVWSCSS
ncbi:hypothetical protein SUGI_0633970 [Cryptomeria japonica]|nr:hypothetical protein SUGI_0633970 [Cryptomeria japonica]